MRRGGTGGADHDGAGIPKVVAVAVEDELAVGILIGVEVVRAIAFGFDDDDAVGMAHRMAPKVACSTSTGR